MIYPVTGFPKIIFDAKDLDHDAWMARAHAEAPGIYEAELRKVGKKRTFEECLACAIYGQAPEQFLVERMGYSNHPEKYMDVISPDGYAVEIKSTGHEGNIGSILVKYGNSRDKFIHSNWVHIFLCNKDGLRPTTYRLEGSYKWNSRVDSYVREEFPHRENYDVWKDIEADNDYLNNYGT